MTIIDLIGTPFPKARIRKVDAETGTIHFDWLDAASLPVDSGGSTAPYTPVLVTPATETEPAVYAEPTTEDIAAAIANPPPPVVDQAAIWADKLAGRIVDSDTGIPLNASIYARNILTSTLVLLREAEPAGYLTAATPQTIWDADNIERTMTVADLRALLIRYGAAWQALHAEFAP